MASSFTGDHQYKLAAPLGGLRKFTRARNSEPLPVERCDFCHTELPADHRHLLDLPRHRLLCACEACLVLSKEQTIEKDHSQYQVVPRRYCALSDFIMTDEQWDDLLLPVNIVYIFYSIPEQRAMAFYPSPAGAMESLLALENWEVLLRQNPLLQTLEPDTEALLINRLQDKHEYYIVPIDACYQLVGLMRMRWKGLNGGEEVWRAMAVFFADLQKNAVAQQTETRSQASRAVKGATDARSEF